MSTTVELGLFSFHTFQKQFNCKHKNSRHGHMLWTFLVCSVQTGKGKGKGATYFIGIMVFKKVFVDIRM